LLVSKGDISEETVTVMVVVVVMMAKVVMKRKPKMRNEGSVVG